MNGKQLKNSILQWAIQGKLVPQDPNDEPASVLLEKIRQEKERLIKEKKIKRDKNASIIFRGEDNSYYEKILATGEVKCIDEEIPFEIPQGWEWCRIRDISQSYIGLTYKPTDVTQTGTIVLRSSNIQEGQLDLNDIVRVSTPIPDKFWVEENDIVICARNGSKKLVGKSAIVDSLKEPMTFGAFMAICKTPIFRYVYNFLQSELFYAQLRGVSGTTTINQLTQNNFNNFLIPIPPLGEQQRINERLQIIIPIVNKYGESQEKLDVLNNSLSNSFRKSILQEAIQGKLVPQIAEEGTARELLEQIRQEKQKLVEEGKLKKTALTDSIIYKGEDNRYYEKIDQQCKDITEEIPFEIPENWEWSRIGSMLSIWSARRVHEKDWRKSGVPFYRAREIGKIADFGHVDNELFIDKSLYNEFSKHGVPQIDDLMMTAVGTLGKTYVVESRIPFYFKDGSVLCIGNPNKINPYYLKLFFESSAFINQYQKESDGTTVSTLTMVRLNQYLIPLPPLNEQQRIVAQIERLFEQLK